MLKSHKLVAGITSGALAVAGLGTAAVALAAPTQTITATVSGAAGTKSKPKPVSTNVVLDTGTTDPNEDKPNTQRAEIFLPKEFKLNGKYFTTCTEAKLVADGPSGCSSKSKVGTGNADAQIGSRPGGATVNLTVQAFNGNKGKELLLYVETFSPVTVQAVIVAKVKKSTESGFGQMLDVTIPSNLQATAGLSTPLTKFVTNIQRKTVTVKSKKRGRTVKTKYGYIESTGCPSGGYTFGVRNTFIGGTTAGSETQADC